MRDPGFVADATLVLLVRRELEARFGLPTVRAFDEARRWLRERAEAGLSERDAAQVAAEIAGWLGLSPIQARSTIMASNEYRGLAVQVDDESLGDVPFGVFEPLFREELERSFPGAVVTIDRGRGARTDYDGIEPDEETVRDCGETAFARAIDALNRE